MLLTKLSKALVIILLTLIIVSCESATENQIIDSDQYLQVGDISQYYYQHTNAYEQNSIIGKTKRSDGLEVFVIDNLYKNEFGESKNTIYAFVKDGFYFTTELEKTTEQFYKDVNPYKEFKHNKINPNQGDSWQAVEGIPDSNNLVYTVKYKGELATPASIFGDVYSVSYYDKSMKTEVDIYYSKECGRLGVKVKSETVLLNYIKKQNIELGKKVIF